MVQPVGLRSIIFWATIAIWSRSAYGQDCDRFNVTRIPEVDPFYYLEMYYFSCADGEFFTSVDVWYGNSVDEIRWICSDGDTSYYPDDASDFPYYTWVTFDVGITAVETSFISDEYGGSSDSLVYFGDSFIGGYNLTPSASTSDGIIFEWSGPFGTGDTYTTETWTSSCPNDSYVTGATWWIGKDTRSLTGIQLECAEVTSTCYPPDLPNQDYSTTTTGQDGDPITTVEDDDGSMVTIIAVAVSVTAAVVAVAVGVCMWCFFRSRHRVLEQAPSLPVRMPMSDPSGPGRPPAYQKPPPAYESPRASVRTDPPSTIYNGQ